MSDPSALSLPSAGLAVADALKRGISGAQIAQALQALQPEETWQLGDVVRDADDPEDSRAWFHGDPVDARPWMGLFGGHAWWHRHSLPTNLALIVRNGRPVVRENLADAEKARHQMAAENARFRAALEHITQYDCPDVDCDAFLTASAALDGDI